MLYFLLNNKLRDKKKELINFRKKRKFILNTPKLGKTFTRGDIITINFWNKTCSYNFEGICLSLKKNNLLSHSTSLKLRNILFNTGVEIIISYYYSRLFRNTLMSDYKRKNFNYRSSKLYYLRNKENQATKI